MTSSSHDVARSSLTAGCYSDSASPCSASSSCSIGSALRNANSVLLLRPLILIAIGLQQFPNPRESRIRRRDPGERHRAGWRSAACCCQLASDAPGEHLGLFWPAVMIALRVRLMTRPGIQTAHRRRRRRCLTPQPASSDIGAVFAMLGGTKRVAAPEPFSGAK